MLEQKSYLHVRQVIKNLNSFYQIVLVRATGYAFIPHTGYATRSG
ncbi:hypothetical protein KKC1_10220 [Calderihabitans maritimus]|uniref:Uncharacterized protein n=1 Tax=Calderihabitans maritimus TaxID=1246530 RepID=A0A1Z5HRA9_9FIRM|nr:hypothetical protein KKC1_10220 [Calderihabitans maritimus]